jgi:uncharacterized protein YrrD
MLSLGQSLINKPILSLQTGNQVGIALEPIINPNNLKIEGWHAQANDKRRGILLTLDVRDIVPQGFVVNDSEAITEVKELIRLKSILDLSFAIIGKAVITDSKKRLGKVSDYSFDKTSFFIQKIYVSESLVKSFSGGMLSIDREQIVEITNKRIVVSEPTVREDVGLAVAPAS